ncbi:MAG: metallophosphoesterase family protein, partial [Candidatus Aenigmarchaeota archaeon]|nr:metallophosphoesterase family protein [Candidatus Aenigmarchaeota archaeon]
IMKEFQPGVETPYEAVESFGNIRYIDNQTVRFNGLRIYGLPFVPSNEPYVRKFSRIPLFRERFESLRNVKIPGKPDVILSHSPPLGILDHSSVVGYTGSIEVLRVLKEKQPRYLFCGHLHEAKGMKQVGRTTVVNLGRTYELFDL